MLNFPDSPAVDQVFASGAVAWRWDGGKWVAKDQSSLSGMVAGQIPIAASATAIASSANLSGDVSSNAALATTLATVNSNVGTFQGLTLNAKGLVTAAANQSYLTANQTITLSGDVSGSGTTSIATTLATVPVAKGGTNKTSWTAGSVAFAASATALGESNADLFWDNTNKRLGIGTTAPGSKLTVSSNTTAPETWPAGTMLQVAAADTQQTRQVTGSYGNSSLLTILRRNGTNAAPSGLLSNDLIGQIGWVGDNGAGGITAPRVAIGGYAAQAWSPAPAQGAYLTFQTTPNGGNATAEAMRIDHNGNVGIGTTGPRAKLEISGGAFTNMAMTDTSAALDTKTFDFALSGGALIGRCVSDNYGSQTSWLQVARSGATATSVTFPAGVGVVVGAPTGGNLGTGKINAVEVRANNVVLTSDKNLKTDIEPLPPALPLVAAIEPKAFHWKPLSEPEPIEGPDGEMVAPQSSGPADFADKLNRGFIAQDVAAVLGGDTETVDLGGMVAVLWQAVRELRAEVAALSADR